MHASAQTLASYPGLLTPVFVACSTNVFTPVSSGDSISLPSGGLVPFHSQQHYKACLLHQWPRQVLHSLAQPVASCPACQPYQAPPAVG